MRIRIRKPIAGIVQGVSLGHLIPGVIYDVDSTLGGYLVSIDAADALPSTHPALVIPLEAPEDFEKALGGVSVTRLNEANDSKPSRIRRRKKRWPPPHDAFLLSGHAESHAEHFHVCNAILALDVVSRATALSPQKGQ